MTPTVQIRTALAAVLAAVVAAGAPLALAQPRATDAVNDGEAAAARGRALFAGALPLVGRIAGHADALPGAASRCINCHGAGEQAPPLARAALLEDRPRRHGPPSRFDEAAFCRLLRTGIDPADVLLARAMPRYALDDADCHALWLHLTRLPS